MCIIHTHAKKRAKLLLFFDLTKFFGKKNQKKRHFVAIYDDFVLFPKPLMVIFSYFCEKAESSVLRAPAYWDAVLAY